MPDQPKFASYTPVYLKYVDKRVFLSIAEFIGTYTCLDVITTHSTSYFPHKGVARLLDRLNKGSCIPLQLGLRVLLQMSKYVDEGSRVLYVYSAHRCKVD